MFMVAVFALVVVFFGTGRHIQFLQLRLILFYQLPI